MRLLAAASFLATFVHALPALAGPLAETAHGVENKVETHEAEDSSGSSSSTDSEPDARSSDDDDCVGCGGTVGVGFRGSSDHPTLSAPSLAGPGRLDLYLGAHAVVGSDQAFVGEVRASKAWFGLGVTGTRYLEEIADKGRTDSIRLDLMAFSLTGRVIAVGGTEVWLDGGFAFSASSEYKPIPGSAWSIRGEHALNPDLGFGAQLRYYDLDHDVSAIEAWGGVRAWFLSAGYRALRFNVGPPLHGPEAGVFVRF